MTVAVYYHGVGGGAAAPASVASLTPDLEVRCTWRPEQFNRVTNPSFATATTGWTAGAGINTAGTSITRITTDGPDGDTTSGELVTQAAAGSGGNYDLGSDRYFSDATYGSVYVARVWLKRVSGGKRAKVILGSLGTTADRATLLIEDLASTWREYVIAWRPSADRTDAELAVTTGDTLALTVRVGKVRIYSPLASQVENGDLESGTTGWDTGAGNIAGAATSFTLMGGNAYGGSSSAELVTTGTSGSGVDYPFGTRKFTSGRTYRLLVALKLVTGTTSVRLRLGSIGTAGDRGDSTVTVTSTWARYSVDWTPSADRTDACLAISNASAAVVDVLVDEVEVFEALDVLAVSEVDCTRGAMSAGDSAPIGALTATVADLTGLYDPRNAASALYPSITDDVPILVRGAYGGRSYGVWAGRLERVEPDPYAEKATVSASDGLRDLEAVDISRPFSTALSFAGARAAAFLAGGFSARQLDLDTSGPEGSIVFDGTDQAMPLLTYLQAFNDATGTVHVASPSPHANVAWTYRTVSRTTQTRRQPSFTVSEDSRGQLPSAGSDADTLITSAQVAYQGYDPLPSQLIVEATAATPYLVYTDDRWGSTDIPEPETIYRLRKRTITRKGVIREGKRDERKWKKRVTVRRLKKVGERWVDPLVPFTLAAGEERDLAIDFQVPISDVVTSVVATAPTIDSLGLISWNETALPHTATVEPARVIITVQGPATINGIRITARPFLPADEAQAEAQIPSRARRAIPIDVEYVGSAAQAEGLADYMTWRYGRQRLRPVIADGLAPARQLGLRVGDGVQVTISKYRISGLVMVVRGVHHQIQRPWPWRTEVALEELPPDASTWVTIDGGAALGIDSSAVLAH